MNEAAITLDGWYVLHDFRSMDWASWKLVDQAERDEAIAEFQAYLANNLQHLHYMTLLNHLPLL